MATLGLRISYNNQMAAEGDLNIHDHSVEHNWALASDLESQCVKFWSMFKPCSIRRNHVSSARIILLWHSQKSIWEREPWLLVYLRWWTWSQRSVSCWLWQSPPCCLCGCTSGQRWTPAGRWHPGQCPQSSGLALPAAWLWGKRQDTSRQMRPPLHDHQALV